MTPSEQVEATLDKIADAKKVPGLPTVFKELFDQIGATLRTQQRAIDRLNRTVGNL